MKTRHQPPERKPNCPSCGSQDIFRFHDVHSVPVNSVLNCHSRQAATAFPRGDISLGFCRACGFIYNTLFNPHRVRYTTGCEESQGYSPIFNAFARKIAQDLVAKYGLHRKRIIEIGCGKGDFLKLICALGQNRGLGFDPAYIPGRCDPDDRQDRIRFVQDCYSEKYADDQGDLICCRMTLEHIPNTAELLGIIRHSIGDRKDTVVFFQVPDVMRIMRACSFEDIYYEHCSYFSPGSLARLFGRLGFAIIDLKTAYDDQYILIEAKPAGSSVEPEHPLSEPVATLAGLVNRFAKNYPAALRFWETQLERFRQHALKVVIWGGGSKGVTFLNVVKGATAVEYVVDLNPFRQQTFIAGTAQRIVAPTFLKDYRPDVVIIMNAVYREEIQRDLNRLGLKPFLTTLKHREAFAL